VSSIPIAGATDVLAKKGTDYTAYILMFSESVVMASTGSINFLESGNVVGKIDLTTAAAYQRVQVSSDHKTIRIEFSDWADTMAGKSVTLNIPQGLVKDEAGNVADAISRTFTFLKGDKDETPPEVTVASPYPGEPDLLMDLSEFVVYFSEPVQAGSGSISLTDRITGKSSLIQASSSSVDITAAQAKVKFKSGMFPAAGIYDITFLQDTFKDLDRTPDNEGGGNNLRAYTQEITISGDAAGPTLDSILPAHEPTPTRRVPISSSILLTFSEPVQATTSADKGLTLTPVRDQTPQPWSTGNKFIAASDMVIQDRKALVTDPGFFPGEIYLLTIDDGAFMDIEENTFPGLTSTYRISTAPLIVFDMINPNFFNSKLYGVGVAVGPDNFVVTAGAYDTTNKVTGGNVTRFRTSRRVNCGEADVHPGFASCAANSQCTEKDGNLIIGEVDRETTIYRKPTPFGQRCFNPAGVATSAIGAVIDSGTETCECPWCLTPPGPNLYQPNATLPALMPNTSYVDAYVPSRATGTQHPLLCQDSYMPNHTNGFFVCEISTWYRGNFRLPYPECVKSECVVPPDTSVVAHFDSLLPSESYNGMDCTTVSETNVIPHGENCAMRCAPGYTRSADTQAGFVCNAGVLVPPVCISQTCPTTDYPNSFATISCIGSGGAAKIGETCPYLCHAGYRGPGTSTTVDAVCTATSAAAEAPNAFVQPTGAEATCTPSECGQSLITQDANGVTSATITYAGTTVYTTATAVCESGFMSNITNSSGHQQTLALTNTLTCVPIVNELAHPEVEWQYQGHTVLGPCTATVCAQPTRSDGYFVPEYVGTQGSVWNLVCNPKYFPTGGPAIASCNQDGTVQYFATCSGAGCLPNSGAAANLTTNCASFVATEGVSVGRLPEGQKCTLACTSNQGVIGNFSCVMGVLKGFSQCYELSAGPPATSKNDFLFAEFDMCYESAGVVLVPDPTTTIFRDDIKESLAKSFKISQDDFHSVDSYRISSSASCANRRLDESDDLLGRILAGMLSEESVSMRGSVANRTVSTWLEGRPRVGELDAEPANSPRRLTWATGLEASRINMEVKVSDPSRKTEIGNSLAGITDDTSNVAKRFKAWLGQKDYTVPSLATITPSITYEAETLVTPAPAPAPEEEESLDTGWIVVIVGVSVLCCCFCVMALLYKFSYTVDDDQSKTD